jgi:hypothetical protein
MVDLVTAILSFTIGSLLTLLAYTKGLQHNYDLKHNIEPKIENPITKVIEKHEEKQQEKEIKSTMSEWINWPDDV